jgi:hypothetical protein
LQRDRGDIHLCSSRRSLHPDLAQAGAQILWNKLGFHPSHILGGMPTDEILKESGHDREQALATIGTGLGLGTSRSGFHSGWGWLVSLSRLPVVCSLQAPSAITG